MTKSQVSVIRALVGMKSSELAMATAILCLSVVMSQIADIEIMRSAADVFAFTTTPENTPKWIGFIEDEHTNEWPPKVGTVYVNSRTDGSEKEFRVTVWEPGARFQLAAVDGSFVVEYTYESVKDDSCRLRISLSTELDEFAATTMQDELENLKSIVESAKRLNRSKNPKFGPRGD